jgi:hypothetical protein
MITRAAFIVVAALAVATAMIGGASSVGVESQNEWRPFAASWSATGHRHTLPVEGGRTAAIIELSGAVVLTTKADGLSTGFHAEVIAFDDAGSISAGRAVWTDRQGNQVFSMLKGEPLASRRRILGTITGGTGLYAGIVGDYELTWQYVIEAEGGIVQGRAVDLKGRFRLGGVSR